MARKKIDRYTSHHIPCIDVFTMNSSKAEQHGKYIIQLDGEWQAASSDIKLGFQEYLSDPADPAGNGINKEAKPSASLNLYKKNYEFEGVLDYSLDLRHLIDYCNDQRCITSYFKTLKDRHYCLALVKVNFENNTKAVREFFYRPEGFFITYDIDGARTTLQYVRYKRTASGAREGACLFIEKNLVEHMLVWSYAGIDPAVAKNIDAVSWEAYTALTLSSIETTIVLDPRQFLFVKDKETVIRGKAFEITNSQDTDILIQRPIQYSGDESRRTPTNKIWDGEGLIDHSVFLENETLKTTYADKCMLLLRGKLFKACMFRTHIQKWFADNGISDETHKVSDLNGYTQAKKISEIRFIIPYSCLKFLKFRNSESEETLIRNWITDLAGKRTVPLFGIIKSDKKSKFMAGKKVFTTYQMLNTLGFDEAAAAEFLQPTLEMMRRLSAPDQDGANYVKYYLDNHFFTPSVSYNNYGEEAPDSSDTFRIFHYREQTASKLLEYDTDYYKTPHYRQVVESLLEHLKKQVMDGRVLIDGVYATLFCNGIELLKSAIDKEYEPSPDTRITITVNGSSQVLPLLKKTEIYSKRFSGNTKLLCARNPHITMGNYYLATNKQCVIGKTIRESVYDRYFVLSDEIVCVNAIDSDIMNTLNGCDFDSDTMLITNNRVLVDLLSEQLQKDGYANKFRVPYNNVRSKTVTPDRKTSESVFLSTVDDKLSNNLIGEIVNLSQRLNSLIWMLAPRRVQQEQYGNWRKWTAKIGKDLYEKGCCTLAVLSNIEIDSAKRSYYCNTRAELRKIRGLLGNDYDKLISFTLWLDDKSNYTTPAITPGETIMDFEILGLDPMGYMIKVITDAEAEAKRNLSKPSIQNYEFVRNLLIALHVSESDSNCTDSLQTCFRTLIDCNDYLKSKNATSKTHRYYKRNYVKDCIRIITCCSRINQVLMKGTVAPEALLWQLIRLLKESSRLIHPSSDDPTYVIVDQNSAEYKGALPEHTHACPRSLLMAALFLTAAEQDTYMIEKLKHL